MAIESNLPGQTEPLNEDINKEYYQQPAKNQGYDPFAEQPKYQQQPQQPQPQQPQYQQQSQPQFQHQPQFQQQPQNNFYQQPQYQGYQPPQNNTNVTPIVINSNGYQQANFVDMSASNEAARRRNMIVSITSGVVIFIVVFVLIFRYAIFY